MASGYLIKGVDLDDIFELAPSGESGVTGRAYINGGYITDLFGGPPFQLPPMRVFSPNGQELLDRYVGRHYGGTGASSGRYGHFQFDVKNTQGSYLDTLDVFDVFAGKGTSSLTVPQWAVSNPYTVTIGHLLTQSNSSVSGKFSVPLSSLLQANPLTVSGPVIAIQNLEYANSDTGINPATISNGRVEANYNAMYDPFTQDGDARRRVVITASNAKGTSVQLTIYLQLNITNN